MDIWQTDNFVSRLPESLESKSITRHPLDQPLFVYCIFNLEHLDMQIIPLYDLCQNIRGTYHFLVFCFVNIDLAEYNITHTYCVYMNITFKFLYNIGCWS